ncbi:MAG TPA: CbiX/SirB N-terminal domain-containing protein [Bryobacteraceae bacterium]
MGGDEFPAPTRRPKIEIGFVSPNLARLQNWLRSAIFRDFRMTPGLIVFAHGSRIESANEGVRAVARDLAKLGSFRYVEPAFLELGQPDLAGAVAALAAQGVERIVVLPYFLTLGLHLERDLPQLITDVQRAHPEVEIRATPPLEGHPALLTALLDRANSALIR